MAGAQVNAAPLLLFAFCDALLVAGGRTRVEHVNATHVFRVAKQIIIVLGRSTISISTLVTNFRLILGCAVRADVHRCSGVARGVRHSRNIGSLVLALARGRTIKSLVLRRCIQTLRHVSC